MDTLRKDVRDLITVSEKLQSALAQGERLTDDETGIIQMCSSELLASLSGYRADDWVNDGNGRADGHSVTHQQTDAGISSQNEA
jgi:hypothetical protein